MRTLYFDLSMGAAGDMLAAALFELLPKNEQNDVLLKLSNLNIPGVELALNPSLKCGISGSHFEVTIHGESEHTHEYKHQHHTHNHQHEHHHEHSHEHSHEHTHVHSGMHDIEHIVSAFDISDSIKTDILNVYNLIAEAESIAHGCPVSQVHFHEVGMMDAVADITTVCMLINHISPDNILASPIHVGSGTVKCAHGIMPVPAPATANILKNVPIYSGNIRSELCTPTGAALIKYFTKQFCDIPVFSIESIGYGMGSKDFENVPNAVRVLLGKSDLDTKDSCIVLSCNIDDMTGEEAGFAIEHFLEIGAKDAYYEQIVGKKSRPALILNVITDTDHKELFIKEIFTHTSTIGIRESHFNRYILSRNTDIIDTPFGKLRLKRSSGYDVNNAKWEYSDLEKIAKKQNISISELKSKLIQYI